MLSVVSIGMQSPAGACARDHAFFPRAEAPPPAPSAFVLPDERPFWVGHARFLPPSGNAADRLVALGQGALDEALASLPEEARRDPALLLCLPAPRPGLSMQDLVFVERALAARAGAPSFVECFVGAAGAFAALVRAFEVGASAAVVLGVDTFFDAAVLAAHVTRPPSPFLRAPLPFAEGAAAIAIMKGEHARRLGIPVLADVLASACRRGRGRDDDDEPVDGEALSTLLRGMPAAGPIRRVFGQGRVDELRSREWDCAVARNAGRFDATCVAECPEAMIGQVGAAAGAFALAQAVTSARHGMAPPGAAFLWSISADGTRGAALIRMEKAPEGALVALDSRSLPRQTARAPLAPQNAPAAEAAFDAATFDPEALLEPANDISPPDPLLPESASPAPPVRLDPARLGSVTLSAFYREIVFHCAETLALLGRDRIEAPRGRVAEVERRLLCQLDAIVAAGPRAMHDVVDFWAARPARPFRAFSAALALSAFAGRDAMAALERGISALPADAEAPASPLAEALLLSAHEDLVATMKTLARAEHAPSRAVALLFLGGRGELAPDLLRGSLEGSAPMVQRAAIRACERPPAAARADWLAPLRKLCREAEGVTAFEAARLLALWGDAEVRHGLDEGWLIERLGARTAELLVLLGHQADGALAIRLLETMPPTPALLSAAGRLGHVELLPRLLPYLADDGLAGAAAEALATACGPAVPPARMHEAAAWREVLDALPRSAAARVRRGKPWSPAVVAEECASGDLARPALERRLDELRARLSRPDPVDVSGWWSEAEAAPKPLFDAARRMK
jgi:hypothetical protein